MSHVSGSLADTNGHEAPERWEAESPFLGSSPAEMPGTPAPEAFETTTAEASPFLAGEGLTDLDASGLRGDLHLLLAELYDTEFDRTLLELSEAAAEAVGESPFTQGETGSPATEQYVREWLEPVHRDAQAMLEAIGESLAGANLPSMTEQELDELLAPHEPFATGANPVFENFLGGLWKKVKGAVKGAIDLAKKGVAAVGKLIPIGPILDRLKALVRPLLERVLQMALNRIPPALRPAAEMLKHRLFGEVYSEEPAGELGSPIPTTGEVAEVQREFDVNTASLLFAEDEAERDAIVGEALEATAQVEDPINALAAAREQFEAELQALPPGGDPQPAVEHFLPAVMAVLPFVRMGISLIGRDRVVRFISNYVAQLIRPYIGDLAPTLSQAIVSTGLGMLSLEAPVDPREVNATVLTGTVEDTVRHVAEQTSEALEHPDLLEATVAEAFNEAAANNFPPLLIKPRHRHVQFGGIDPVGHPQAGYRDHRHRRHHGAGMWVRVPRTHGYKRYTGVLTAHVTPSIARQVRVFGGVTLEAFLRDRYGLESEVNAPVHLYEALPGTTLGRIAAHERRTPGLGRAKAYWKLQPLTPEVAGVLLGEPGLGHHVEAEYLARPEKIAVGERFYYLELRGRGPHHAATVVAAPGAPAAAGSSAGRSSELNVRVDFPAHKITLSQYLSDADAQLLAATIAKSGPVGGATELRRAVHHGLTIAMSSAPHGHLRWIEPPPASGLPATPGAEAPVALAHAATAHRVRAKLREWIDAAMIGFVTQRPQELVSAAQQAAHGVTIVVQLGNVPGMERLLSPTANSTGPGNPLHLFGPGAPTVTIQIAKGFRGA
ncbi:MAG: hypothetical protein QOF83_9 [Solirubrobacteraceae bacterium]|jgi:hypothetical protein|nr:hypothetical protein [Solirubrobacteraceae bacterium]